MVLSKGYDDRADLTSRLIIAGAALSRKMGLTGNENYIFVSMRNERHDWMRERRRRPFTVELPERLEARDHHGELLKEDLAEAIGARLRPWEGRIFDVLVLFSQNGVSPLRIQSAVARECGVSRAAVHTVVTKVRGLIA